ncbi:MAG: ACT domain-containing protein [Pseudolysinimonas sp.]
MTSPAQDIGVEVYLMRYDRAPKTIDGDFAVIFDGREATVVSSAPARILEAQRTDRGIEGPFAAIRLEIRDSVGAGGFIAAATGACADAGIGAYLLSTFSYDYLFVAPQRLGDALTALAGASLPVE